MEESSAYGYQPYTLLGTRLLKEYIAYNYKPLLRLTSMFKYKCAEVIFLILRTKTG